MLQQLFKLLFLVFRKISQEMIASRVRLINEQQWNDFAKNIVTSRLETRLIINETRACFVLALIG